MDELKELKNDVCFRMVNLCCLFEAFPVFRTWFPPQIFGIIDASRKQLVLIVAVCCCFVLYLPVFNTAKAC